MPGSIQKRGNSSYLLTVSHGYDKTGKQQRFTKTIHAKNASEMAEGKKTNSPVVFLLTCLN